MGIRCVASKIKPIADISFQDQNLKFKNFKFPNHLSAF
jgi:hypothetical protein